MSIDAYNLNLQKKVIEMTRGVSNDVVILEENANNSFKKALFYMYGSCESVSGILVHSLLKKHRFWNGLAIEA